MNDIPDTLGDLHDTANDICIKPPARDDDKVEGQMRDTCYLADKSPGVHYGCSVPAGDRNQLLCWIWHSSVIFVKSVAIE